MAIHSSRRSPPREDPPPLYEPSDSASTGAPPAFEGSPTGPIGPPVDSKPTNFVHVVRSNQGIKETYVLDPFLAIPDSFLPPLGGRRNQEESILRHEERLSSRDCMDPSCPNRRTQVTDTDHNLCPFAQRRSIRARGGLPILGT